MQKNYYDILNVNKNATEDEIKKSFRKLSIKYHPDKQQGKTEEEKKAAEEKFKEVAEAYSVLSNKEKRQHYDTFGTMDGMGSFNSTGMDIDEIMKQFMGAGFGGFHYQQPQTYQGTDKHLKINITLEELYNNVTKTIKYTVDRHCSKCGGKGSTSGKIETCPYCHGTGYITQTYRHGNMMTQSSQPCTYCNSTGTVVKDKCKECNGTGLVSTTEELEIIVPPIDKINTKFIKRGAGNSCYMNKGINGDLYFTYSLESNEDFQISRNNPIDIIKDVEVPVIDCITGTTIKVTHLDKSVHDIKIKECTEDGDIYRIKNKGFKLSNGLRGDLLIRINIKMPKKINNDDIKLLNKLKKSDNFK